IKLYALSYGVVAAILFVYLYVKKELYLTFTISRVTKKFYKKIVSLASLVYFGGIVYTVAQFIDTLIIMSVIGIESAGIFALGSVLSGLVQAPQSGAMAGAIPRLAKTWKDKNYDKINLIYQRSGINLLIASL